MDISRKPDIFKNKNSQLQFDKDGYVVIDFISQTETKAIVDKFHQLHSDLPKGFYSAAFSPDVKFKKEIFSHTENLFQKAIDENFYNYKVLGGTYLCKAPGEDSLVGVHQDWTVVDESRYYSATIWVPMVDTDEENGTLRVLPGSHLFFDSYRSNNIPVSYRGSEQLLWDNMITVPVKAGQAFVLNHAVIHGSSPNRAKRERLVVAFGIIPKAANLMYYHKEQNDDVEKYSMPDDFFQRYYNIGKRPLFGQLVEKFNYPVPIADEKKIKQLIENKKIFLPKKYTLLNIIREIKKFCETINLML